MPWGFYTKYPWESLFSFYCFVFGQGKKKKTPLFHLCGTRWLHREQVHTRQVFSEGGYIVIT